MTDLLPVSAVLLTALWTLSAYLTARNNMNWLSAIGALIQLVLRVIGFISDNNAQEAERKRRLEDEIKELEEKDRLDPSDITSGFDRINRV
jgi:hypothetical protein